MDENKWEEIDTAKRGQAFAIHQSSPEFIDVAVTVAVNQAGHASENGRIVFKNWRRVRDSNPRWRFCRPLPYHLANSPPEPIA